MAALTAADYREIRAKLYSAGNGKDELKALPSLPSKADLGAAFQNLEDWWDANRLAAKAEVDTGIGFTTSAALARFIFVAWFLNRLARGL